jgi:hypothetical protein
MALMLVASVAPAMANDRNDNNDFHFNRFNDFRLNDFRFHDFNDDDFFFVSPFFFDGIGGFNDCGFDWDGPVTPLDCH